jgi:ArsR family transcriptional regulator, virulence genes transcriptional regulator
MKPEHKNIYALHANFCKILANPKRLMILAFLSKAEASVGQIAKAIDVPLTNVSQHLNILRTNNIVHSRKEGQMVYYSLVDPRITDGCNIIRSVLLDTIKQSGIAAKEVNMDDLIP